MSQPRNIGPGGRGIRFAAGTAVLLGAARVLADDRLRKKPALPILITIAFVLVEEARKNTCLVHAALGKRSREARRLYGRLRPKQRALLRRRAVEIIGQSILVGIGSTLVRRS